MSALGPYVDSSYLVSDYSIPTQCLHKMACHWTSIVVSSHSQPIRTTRSHPPTLSVPVSCRVSRLRNGFNAASPPVKPVRRELRRQALRLSLPERVAKPLVPTEYAAAIAQHFLFRGPGGLYIVVRETIEEPLHGRVRQTRAWLKMLVSSSSQHPGPFHAKSTIAKSRSFQGDLPANPCN